MHCERLIKLIKTWYISVKEETMAPARMVSFMEKHAATCPICQDDPNVHDEIAKITEIVFPEAKNPRPVDAEDESEAFEDDDLLSKAGDEDSSDDSDEGEEVEVFAEDFDAEEFGDDTSIEKEQD